MTCVKVGTVAPDFSLKTDTGAEWRLSEQRGTPRVLVFHRHLQ